MLLSAESAGGIAGVVPTSLLYKHPGEVIQEARRSILLSQPEGPIWNSADATIALNTAGSTPLQPGLEHHRCS